jgi:hypothetical protein
LGRREEKVSARRGTVAFYRQIPSADVETNCKPSAASIEEDMSALIARNHTANRKACRFKFRVIAFDSMDQSKSSSLIIFVIGNYFFTFLIIGLIAAGISLLNKPKPLRTNIVAEAFFSYYLLFTIGINNVVNFFVHVFFGDMAAKFIGWEDSPFQAEVGFASLGVGIAGVIAFKASLPFRFATLIPPSAFSLGAAGGHIYQMIVAHNFSPGNVGLVLPSNFLIPLTGFVFLWLSYKHPPSGMANRKLI